MYKTSTDYGYEPPKLALGFIPVIFPLNDEATMETMIAYCGIICSKCPVYLATQADDNKAREDVAKLWSKQYGMDIKPQEANCDGCLQAGGRLFSHCRVCGIRACGMEKKVNTCATCEDYACEQLKAFHSFAPHAGRMLEKLRLK